MKIMICTIMRNSEKTISRWWNTVKKIAETYPLIEFDISIYENDSTDGTKNFLKETVILESDSYFSDTFITCEDINTESFGSVVDAQRVLNLATARNKCLHQSVDINSYDYFLSVEADADFNVSLLKYLFDKGENWDILSGASYYPLSKGFYDQWATRRGANEDRWDMPMGRLSDPSIPLFKGPFSELHPKSLASRIDEVVEVYSTFNLVCLYRAKPITEGHLFGGYSQNLDSFDCDTAVICENFRRAGYNRIGMLPHLEVFNDPDMMR